MTYSCSTRARPPPGRPGEACAPRPAGWICADAGPRAVGGLLAGWARASTVPSASVHALRTLPRARRDLIPTRTATRQRLHDELVVLFPELVRFLPTLPGRTDLGEPAVLPC